MHLSCTVTEISGPKDIGVTTLAESTHEAEILQSPSTKDEAKAAVDYIMSGLELCCAVGQVVCIDL